MDETTKRAIGIVHNRASSRRYEVFEYDAGDHSSDWLEVWNSHGFVVRAFLHSNGSRTVLSKPQLEALQEGWR